MNAPFQVLVNGIIYLPQAPEIIVDMPLSTLLREIRQGFGWTLEEACVHLSVSKSYLWGLEKGETLPSLKMAWRIAKLYNVPIQVLARATEK